MKCDFTEFSRNPAYSLFCNLYPIPIKPPDHMFIENYTDLPGIKKIALRKVARKLVLDTLSNNPLGARNIQTALSKNRVQFLYLHHVFRDEYASLRILLKELSKHHTFISYNEAVSKIVSGN